MIENSEIEIVKTKEGVHTLINNRLNEHYHSLYGSMQESLHVFIKNGLLAVNKNLPEIKILEMGFGTGLNAILTFRENHVLQKHIHYTTVDSTSARITPWITQPGTGRRRFGNSPAGAALTW